MAEQCPTCRKLRYYTKYGWQTTALAYIEESTTTTDLIVADTEEIEGIAFKAAEFAAGELNETLGKIPLSLYFRGEYENWKRNYIGNNPSEALKKRRNYGPLPRFK